MNRPVRVLFHVDSLAIGGLENKLRRLALLLDRTRFEPVVSYSKEWGPCGVELRQRGVRLERIVPSPRAVETVRQIRDLAPGIFHSFSTQKNADDVWAARQAGTPVIVTARGNVRYWAPGEPARDWEIERNGMTDYITACCDTVAGVASTAEGIDREKLVVIHNGVEMPPAQEGPTVREEFGIPKEALLAGYAARYRPLKAHEMLLHAWREVVCSRPDAFLLCCGADDREFKETLQELVCRLALAQNVMLQDVRRDMASFYGGLDMYVHASLSEGFSNAILEAMSYGLPVIATAAGGTPEAIEDGISGILIPAEVRALSAAVLELAEDPDRRRVLGDTARRRIRDRFLLSRMVRGYEALYERAVRRPELRLTTDKYR